jgi:hypothetical protein
MRACYHAFMAQMTWRPEDELYERVRRAAKQRGRSINAYVTAVLDTATNPDGAATEWDQVRERLANAGLLVPTALAPPATARPRPSPDKVAQARAAAGRGTSLAELVASSR